MFTFTVVGVCVISALNKLELGKFAEPNFAYVDEILFVSYPPKCAAGGTCAAVYGACIEYVSVNCPTDYNHYCHNQN